MDARQEGQEARPRSRRQALEEDSFNWAMGLEDDDTASWTTRNEVEAMNYDAERRDGSLRRLQAAIKYGRIQAITWA